MFCDFFGLFAESNRCRTLREPRPRPGRENEAEVTAVYNVPTESTCSLYGSSISRAMLEEVALAVPQNGCVAEQRG